MNSEHSSSKKEFFKQNNETIKKENNHINTNIYVSNIKQNDQLLSGIKVNLNFNTKMSDDEKFDSPNYLDNLLK